MQECAVYNDTEKANPTAKASKRRNYDHYEQASDVGGSPRWYSNPRLCDLLCASADIYLSSL